jgi:hypothetical protein
LYRWRDELDPIEPTGEESPPQNARESTLRKEVHPLKQLLAEKVLEVDFFKAALQKVEARRQRTGINLIALKKIDRSPRVASEARVEELVWIWGVRPLGKNKLHLVFVGIADRDDSVVRPHWASHPLSFLEDLPVGRKDDFADAGERLSTPVCESCNQLVNTFRWIHGIFMPPNSGPVFMRVVLLPQRLARPISSKEVVERHGLSTSTIPKEQAQGRRQTEWRGRSLEFGQTGYKCNRVSEC